MNRDGSEDAPSEAAQNSPASEAKVPVCGSENGHTLSEEEAEGSRKENFSSEIIGTNNLNNVEGRLKDDPQMETGSLDSPHPSVERCPTAAEPSPAPEAEKDIGLMGSTQGKDGEASSVYHVKWVGWNDSKTAVVTQNENGPCPLLSIVNVLLLRGKMCLLQGCEVVSAEQLLHHLGDVILESVPEDLLETRKLDYAQNVNDAIAILPKLQTGLDVNVRFTGVADFEYTPECIIFDLLNISLYHGWLMDPQQEDVVRAVHSLTYNQLVERIIQDKCSPDSELVSQSLVAQQFLEDSASQLTYHGLCELNHNIKEGELGVFFRNNHFSTIYKRKSELFLLVTDQGFLKEPKVVWETLSNIDGDGHFVDDCFVTVSPPPSNPDVSSGPSTAAVESPVSNAEDAAALAHDRQVDHDHRLAVALASEDEKRYEREQHWEEYKNKLANETGTGGHTMSDEELAKRLQAEEDLAARNIQEQMTTSVGSSALSGRTESYRGTNTSPTMDPNVASSSTLVGRTRSSSSSHRSKNCSIL